MKRQHMRLASEHRVSDPGKSAVRTVIAKSRLPYTKPDKDLSPHSRWMHVLGQ